MNNRDAYIILNALPDIGPLRVQSLINFFGEPKLILEKSKAELQRVQGIGANRAEVLLHWRNHCDLDEEKKRVEQAGVTLVTRDDECYPPLLREIHDPPLCLYVRGNPDALKRTASAVAMVGSRRTTNYGKKVADNLGTAAAAAGWPVISGLARGIDTIVHEAVVRMDGCAIAVIGSGLGRIYPQENIKLARRIADNGVVVSEFPMHYAPAKRSFPMRNRIIAGMASGTVVIEAGHRSGSLITASQALEQNRQVFAIPGRVDSPQSKGCNKLIRDGAYLVESFQDILETFSFLPGLAPESPESRYHKDQMGAVQTNTNPGGGLTFSELEAKLLALLETEEMQIDNLVAEVDEPIQAVYQALFTLELKRVVRQLPGKRVTKIENIQH